MKVSDMKSHFYLARTLGVIGRPALATLRRFVATEGDPYSRSFALVAVGEVRGPGVRADRHAYARTPRHQERAGGAVLRILGRDEAHEWDRAYIVRREAEEALRHIEAR